MNMDKYKINKTTKFKAHSELPHLHSVFIVSFPKAFSDNFKVFMALFVKILMENQKMVLEKNINYFFAFAVHFTSNASAVLLRVTF
jgi:hypothetical protein